MKKQVEIILISLRFGLFLWLIDTLLEYFIFREAPFFDVLIRDVPRHGIYIRSLIVICFIAFGIVCARFLARQQQIERKLHTKIAFHQHLVDTISTPIFYINTNFVYTGCNTAFADFFGMTPDEVLGQTVYDIAPKELADIYQEKDVSLFKEPGSQIFEAEICHVDQGRRHVILNKATFHNQHGDLAGLVGTFLDITEIREVERQREGLILELQETLDTVQHLNDFLPSCPSCKKIRKDKGFWNQVDEFIQQHSEAEFGHRICPDCLRKLYPDFAGEILDD